MIAQATATSSSANGPGPEWAGPASAARHSCQCFTHFFSSEAVNGPTGWLKAVSVHSGASGLVPDSCNLSTMLTLDSD